MTSDLGRSEVIGLVECGTLCHHKKGTKEIAHQGPIDVVTGGYGSINTTQSANESPHEIP